MHITVFEGDKTDVFFEIIDDDPDIFKPYYKEMQSCANFLCDYYNFTISNATSEYILDYLKIPDNKKQEIQKLLHVDKNKEKMFREIFELVLSEYYPSLNQYTAPQKMAAYQVIIKDNSIKYRQDYVLYSYFDAFLDESIEIYVDTNHACEENMLKVLKTLRTDSTNFVYGLSIQMNSLWDFICFCMDKVITDNTPIKRCANCGKFFSPTYRINESYCNYEYQNGKTCKEIGYANKVNKSAILKEYRKIYKTKNAWKNRNIHKIPEAEIMFTDWHEQAKDMLEQVQQGNISEQDFFQWLEENK